MSHNISDSYSITLQYRFSFYYSTYYRLCIGKECQKECQFQSVYLILWIREKYTHHTLNPREVICVLFSLSGSNCYISRTEFHPPPLVMDEWINRRIGYLIPPFINSLTQCQSGLRYIYQSLTNQLPTGKNRVKTHIENCTILIPKGNL